MSTVPDWNRLHAELPIFGMRLQTDVVVYTPGRILRISRMQADQLRQQWRGNPSFAVTPAAAMLAAQLEAQARRTIAAWLFRETPPFQPECLTVYLNNRCNCRCAYCYAAGIRTTSRDTVSLKAIQAACRLVVAVCRETRKPFMLVLHGGGEPTLDFGLVQESVRETRALALEAGCGWRGHLATNGVMSGSHAAWVASQFDSIGLSHDGPPDLHDRQRPLKNGRPSLPIVERTYRRLLAGTAHIGLRTTVLPSAVDRLVEIVDYLIGRLGARDVRLEPAYRLGDADTGAFDTSLAGRFVESFMAARAHAHALGASLLFSGARLSEVHGPYCSVLRNTLHLVPGNIATACFFRTGTTDEVGAATDIGAWAAQDAAFVLEQGLIRQHCERAARISETCRDCAALYHCTRGCPDVCVAAAGCSVADPPRFRCEITRGIVTRLILEAAARLPVGGQCTHP